MTSMNNCFGSNASGVGFPRNATEVNCAWCLLRNQPVGYPDTYMWWQPRPGVNLLVCSFCAKTMPGRREGQTIYLEEETGIHRHEREEFLGEK